MPSLYEFTWKLEAPITDKTDSKATLFVRFFTEDILEHIYVESIKYAKLKRSHNFDTDLDTLKKLLLLSLLIKTSRVLGKYCRRAKYFRIITHVKENI